MRGRNDDHNTKRHAPLRNSTSLLNLIVWLIQLAAKTATLNSTSGISYPTCVPSPWNRNPHPKPLNAQARQHPPQPKNSKAKHRIIHPSSMNQHQTHTNRAQVKSRISDDKSRPKLKKKELSVHLFLPPLLPSSCSIHRRQPPSRYPAPQRLPYAYPTSTKIAPPIPTTRQPNSPRPATKQPKIERALKPAPQRQTKPRTHPAPAHQHKERGESRLDEPRTHIPTSKNQESQRCADGDAWM